MSLKTRNADGTCGEIADKSAALEIYRHSVSHLMAAAVHSLFRQLPARRRDVIASVPVPQTVRLHRRLHAGQLDVTPLQVTVAQPVGVRAASQRPSGSTAAIVGSEFTTMEYGIQTTSERRVTVVRHGMKAGG